MASKIIATTFFINKAKRLLKKFPSLINELSHLEDQLLQNPKTGTNLGGNIYKVRLKSRSKGKGKSGGFRIITYLVTEKDDGVEVFLITIYDKSEEENISKDNLLAIIKKIFG